MTVISFDLALLDRDIENLLGRLVSLDVEAHAAQKALRELQWFRERLVYHHEQNVPVLQAFLKEPSSSAEINDSLEDVLEKKRAALD